MEDKIRLRIKRLKAELASIDQALEDGYNVDELTRERHLVLDRLEDSWCELSEWVQ